MSSILPAVGLRVWRLGPLALMVRLSAVVILTGMVLLACAIGVGSLVQGTLAMPEATLITALFQPEHLSTSQHYVLWDIRLPRIALALLCGALLGMAGAAMQANTRNGLADPGLIGVKEGATVVVLIVMLLYPSMSLLWRPVVGTLGGLLVAFSVLLIARDPARPRFLLTGIGFSWLLAAGLGVFISTANIRTVQTALLWMAGSLSGSSWLLAAVALGWSLPAVVILLWTHRAGEVVALGETAARGLGVRVGQLSLLRFVASVMLSATAVSCVGSLGFVGLMAPHMTRLVLRSGLLGQWLGSACTGAILVLMADSIGRLAFAPLQLPAGIVIALVGAPFFLLLLWQRRDHF